MDQSKKINRSADHSFTEASSRCVFETIWTNRIQDKFLEERLRYDKALLRANTVLQGARSLKEQVRALADDFHGMEKQFQSVISLNIRFRREAKERVDYLDKEHYLAGLIATLIAEHEDKELGDFPYSLIEAKNRTESGMAGRRMSRHKRRLLYRLLCVKGTHQEHGTPQT
ncbi:hypothetical protein ACOMHN_003782 [Nucella lapillus]